ncbi:mycothiol transferase [Kitasatospora sp. NPDC003701]
MTTPRRPASRGAGVTARPRHARAHRPRSGGTFDIGTADPAGAFEFRHEECARSPEIVNATERLDVIGRRRDGIFSLRSTHTRVIEEFARHNDHVGLRREHLAEPSNSTSAAARHRDTVQFVD